MQPALFDTSIYISALRQGDSSALNLKSIAPESPLWLSSVVLEELYAGADERAEKALQQLERDFARVKRILVPALSDWTQAGRVLARLGSRYDYEHIGRGRLTNDALIAISAARLGIRLLTANQRDFARLAEFHHFQWQVIKS